MQAESDSEGDSSARQQAALVRMTMSWLRCSGIIKDKIVLRTFSDTMNIYET